jgi:hypothetical protein
MWRQNPLKCPSCVIPTIHLERKCENNIIKFKLKKDNRNLMVGFNTALSPVKIQTFFCMMCNGMHQLFPILMM